MPFLARPATPADYADILTLQNENYVGNLAPEERADGFVSTPFSLELLQSLEAPNRFFIVRDKESNDLAGYVFAGSWSFCSRWSTFQVAIARFPLSWKGQPLGVNSTFQYGPVCVAQPFRGQGVLPLLFDAVKTATRHHFDVGTTWINAANGRSLKAHTQKLGMVPLDEWEWNGNRYVMLGFDTNS